MSPERMPLVRYLDVVLAVVGAAVAIVLGAPVLGCAIGAGGWVLQRLVAAVDTRWTTSGDRAPMQQFGITLFEGFGRIWLLAAAIVIAAVVGKRADGLAAAIVIFCAYTVAFAMKVLSGPPDRGGSEPS